MAGNVELQVGRYNGELNQVALVSFCAQHRIAGWWFGTFYIILYFSHHIGNNNIILGTFAAVGQVHLIGDFDEALLQNCSNLLDLQAEVQRFTSSLAWRWSKNISLFT